MGGPTFDAMDIDVTSRAESCIEVRHVTVSVSVLNRLKIPAVFVFDVLHWGTVFAELLQDVRVFIAEGMPQIFTFMTFGLRTSVSGSAIFPLYLTVCTVMLGISFSHLFVSIGVFNFR